MLILAGMPLKKRFNSQSNTKINRNKKGKLECYHSTAICLAAMNRTFFDMHISGDDRHCLALYIIDWVKGKIIQKERTREKHGRLFSNFQFKTYFLTAIRGLSRFNWTHLLHISWIVDCCSCAENNTIINTNRIQPSNDEIVDAMQPVLWVWSHSVCLHLFYSHFNFFNIIYTVRLRKFLLFYACALDLCKRKRIWRRLQENALQHLFCVAI